MPPPRAALGPLLALLLLLLLLAARAPAALAAPPRARRGAYTVDTFAGGGWGFGNGPAEEALFTYPSGLALLHDGALLVADSGTHRIRRVERDGFVSTLAGSGLRGFEEGTGTSANFSHPLAVAVAPDGRGDAFVADTDNHCVRRVTAAGVVTTFAGSGEIGGADGSGTAASFTGPFALAVGADGAVYVADTADRVRRISPDGFVSTLAGNGQQGGADGAGTAARFRSPAGIAVDAAGTVFVSDLGNHRLRRIAPDGAVSVLAGSSAVTERDRAPGFADGAPADARFTAPHGLAIDPRTGALLVADHGNHALRSVAVAPGGDGAVSTIAGNGTAGFANGDAAEAVFFWPWSLAVAPDGTIFVADSANHRIRRLVPLRGGSEAEL